MTKRQFVTNRRKSCCPDDFLLEGPHRISFPQMTGEPAALFCVIRFGRGISKLAPNLNGGLTYYVRRGDLGLSP